MPPVLVFASILALTAAAGAAQPPESAPNYPAQPTAQPGYPPDSGQGYGGQGYGGQGQGGGRWAADPETRSLRQRMRAVCAADVSTYCAGAGQPGGDSAQGGRQALHQCMMANQTRFTPQCQQAMADLQAHRRQLRMNGGAPDAGQPGAMPPSDASAPNPPQQ